MDLQFLHFLITQIKVENKADKLSTKGIFLICFFQSSVGENTVASLHVNIYL